ncbi:MAG: hypothetical protein AAGI52_05550 [Bacteroidota bacterium]
MNDTSPRSPIRPEWAEEAYPLPWVKWVLVVCVVVAMFGFIRYLSLVPATAAAVIVAATLLIEARLTGTIRTRARRRLVTRQPVRFWFNAAMIGGIGGIALLVLVNHLVRFTF